MESCRQPGCDKPARRGWRGYCAKHYFADQYAEADPTPGDLANKVFVKVDAGGPCWLWTGKSRDSYGHGILWFYLLGARTGRYVHRLVWEHLVGPIPDGMTLDHLCRITNCVNPDHLEVTTMGENVLRGFGPSAQNARKTHCKRGHALTGENVYYRKDRPGHRHCKTCDREGQRRRYATRKQGGLTGD